MALIHPTDAQRLGVQTDDPVVLSSNSRQAEFSARVSNKVPPAVVAVSSTIPETKNFFHWQTDGAGANIEPMRVNIEVPQAVGTSQ